MLMKAVFLFPVNLKWCLPFTFVQLFFPLWVALEPHVIISLPFLLLTGEHSGEIKREALFFHLGIKNGAGEKHLLISCIRIHNIPAMVSAHAEIYLMLDCMWWKRQNVQSLRAPEEDSVHSHFNWPYFLQSDNLIPPKPFTIVPMSILIYIWSQSNILKRKDDYIHLLETYIMYW